jgi:O-succinylbenzoate synthase
MKLTGVELRRIEMPLVTLPGDTSGSNRYYQTDITSPFTLVDGHLRVPTAPGIGVDPLPDQLAAVTKSVELLAL